MSKRKPVIGYIVLEALDLDGGIYVPLALSVYKYSPDEGILEGDSPDTATFFGTHAEARAAIKRTHHWQLAFGLDGVNTKLCKIVPLYGRPAVK